MSNLMTAVAAEGHAIPVVDPATADGVFSLMWLVIALPALGAVVLLVGGAMFPKQVDRWGHLLGCLLPIGSFVISLVMFVQLLGRDDGDRQVGQHLYTWIDTGSGEHSLHVGMDLLYDPLTALFLLLITGVGSLIHVYSIGCVGVLTRRNAIVVFMCVELMLNASNLALVAFAKQHGNLDGQVGAFFVMVVAAAEVVVGLAIIMTIFRTRRSASVDDASLLKY